jgi:hypothetical protein
MVGKLTMMFWGAVIAGPIMVFWIIVREVFIHLLTLSIFVRTILIVLVILKCTFYVTNLFNNIIYF